MWSMLLVPFDFENNIGFENILIRNTLLRLRGSDVQHFLKIFLLRLGGTDTEDGDQVSRDFILRLEGSQSLAFLVGGCIN